MGAITTAFVQQYNDTMAMLVQQKMTKLRGSVLVDTDFTGEYKFYGPAWCYINAGKGK